MQGNQSWDEDGQSLQKANLKGIEQECGQSRADMLARERLWEKKKDSHLRYFWSLGNLRFFWFHFANLAIFWQKYIPKIYRFWQTFLKFWNLWVFFPINFKLWELFFGFFFVLQWKIHINFFEHFFMKLLRLKWNFTVFMELFYVFRQFHLFFSLFFA